MRANASKRKAMSYDRMREEERRLEGEVDALPSRARDTDAEEDARFGESMRGDEWPEEWRLILHQSIRRSVLGLDT